MTDLGKYLLQSAALIRRTDPAPAQKLIDRLLRMKVDGIGNVWVIGNGGSQANASHLVLHLQEHGWNAHDLLSETAQVTALANDTDYAKVGSRTLRMLGGTRDILIVITGSGDSPNVVIAQTEAKRIGMYCFGMLGFAGGQSRYLCDDFVLVASTEYGCIEDCHSVLLHAINESIK